MGTKYLWYCPQCHCTDVQVKAWIKPNCNDHVIDLDSGEETGWCPNCEAHLSLEFNQLNQASYGTLNLHDLVWVNNRIDPLSSGIYIVKNKQHTGLSEDKILVYKSTQDFEWHVISDIYILPDEFTTLGWECTDPDNHQYCKKINETTFTYKEFNRFTFPPEYLDKNSLTIEGLFYNDEYWIEDTIDMDGYSEEEIHKHISAYYKDLDDLKSIYGDNWKQIVCECIFEQESELY